MKKIKIVCSGRNFFPGGAFWLSTRRQEELARAAGYDGIEFLPTWRVAGEVVRHGRLLCSDKFVVSLHRDWRFDVVMETKIRKKPWWNQFRRGFDWLFPLSGRCLSVLKKLQKRYKVAVSIMWFEDAKNFSRVMLELWNKKSQGVGYKELLRWLKEDKENHGVVMDTAKLTSWLESEGLVDKKEEVIKRLLPHTFEIHWRLKKKGRVIGLKGLGGGLKEDTDENLRLILKLGYQGRVVVEAGWPDLDDNQVGWLRADWSKWRDQHKRLVRRVRRLCS